MTENELTASRELSRLDLNLEYECIGLKTYWCRVASSSVDKWNYKEHSHSFFELQLCLDGECSFSADGKVHTVKKGMLLLFPPRKKHIILNATQDFSKFIWGFGVKDAKLSETLSEATEKTRIFPADESVLSAVGIILKNSTCDDFGAYGIIKGQLDFIFTQLIRQTTGMKQTGEFSKKPSMQAEEIKKFISDNLSGKICTADVAAQFFLTERQIEGICKREYKMTVSELKGKLRLDLIRKLLAETELTLGEIADRCGFADEFVMSKFFKKHEGMSPGKYRLSSKE